jgi:hypothetical protein
MTASPTPRPLSIRIESADLQFGTIDASGEVGGAAASGLVGQLDQYGAFFVLPQAVTLVVEGELPWSVGCSAAGADPTSAQLIASGQLQWRQAGVEDWTAFAAEGNGPICLTNPEGGPRIYVLDIRLRVESTDPPGPFAATLAFEIA